MGVNRHGLPTVKRRANWSTLLNLATAGLTAAWFAAACYAITYLVSH
jgi:hypothetical protein